MDKISGSVWKFGDNIDTDIIIPARHLVLPLEEMKAHAMAPIRPQFAALVGSGDIIAAGRNFGCGSSREQAPAVLLALGINAVVADSFARIFFRNAVNLGLTVMECPDLFDHVQEQDLLEIEPASGGICLPEKKMAFSGTRLPDFLLAILDEGGLIAHLKANSEDKENSNADPFGSKIQHN